MSSRSTRALRKEAISLEKSIEANAIQKRFASTIRFSIKHKAFLFSFKTWNGTESLAMQFDFNHRPS